MSYTLGDQLSAARVLLANQPLRATWRRSATASAQEFFSFGIYDTSMPGLTAKLDEALPGPAHLTRVSPWTYGDDIATCDLVATSAPAGFTASEAAYEADQLVKGFPLVRLEARTRVSGEENRVAQRDDANKSAQADADKQTIADQLKDFLDGLGDLAKLGVVVGVIALFILYAPRPKKAAPAAD